MKNLETGEVITNISNSESNIDLESMKAFTYYVNEDINELNGMYSYNGRIDLLNEGKYELKQLLGLITKKATNYTMNMLHFEP